MENNPDFILIADQVTADTYGFYLNEAVPTVQKAVNWPDSKGYEIRVNSPKYNKSIQLEPHEYSLLPVAQLIANDITAEMRKHFA